MEVPRKRMADDEIHSQSDQKSIQTSLDEIGQDISHIKSNLEKKKPKVTLGDLNAKLDIILQYIGVEK